MLNHKSDKSYLEKVMEKAGGNRLHRLGILGILTVRGQSQNRPRQNLGRKQWIRKERG